MYRTTYNIRAVATHNDAIEAATALVVPLGLDDALGASWEYKAPTQVLCLQTISRGRPDVDGALKDVAPLLGYHEDWHGGLLQAVVEDLRNDREVTLSQHANLRQFEFPSVKLQGVN